MVDRLEELLALMEDEDDEDEQRDMLELRAETAAPAAPASEIKMEEAVENGEDEMDPVLRDEESALAKAGESSWAPDVRIPLPESQEKMPGADGAADSGAENSDFAEDEAAEFLWDELTAPVMRQNGTVAMRRPGTGDVEMTELAGPSGRADAAELGAVVDSLTEAEKGLEGLYKRTVQSSRPAAQNLPVEQAGRTLRAEEPGRTAALTVDELDRAVRRDSRRYDGGMTLF